MPTISRLTLAALCFGCFLGDADGAGTVAPNETAVIRSARSGA